MTERIGNWLETYTGKHFYPIDPRPEDFELEDISHSLSQLCRFNGHAIHHYSVAQHCCLLHDIIPEHKSHALFHDCSEAYICDIPSPLKPFLTNYKEIEYKIQSMIYAKFGLSIIEPDIVKEYDSRIILDEKLALFPSSKDDWSTFGPKLGVAIEPWSHRRAKQEFYDRATLYI